MTFLDTLPGLTTKKREELAKKGLTTRAKLAKSGELSSLPKQTQAYINYNVEKNVPLATSRKLVSDIKKCLRVDDVAHHAEGHTTRPASRTARRRRSAVSFHEVGSIRRREPRSKDIDILLVTDKPVTDITSTCTGKRDLNCCGKVSHLFIADVYAKGAKRWGVIIGWRGVASDEAGKLGKIKFPRYFAVDFFITKPDELPFALFHYTGSRAYNIRTRAHAKRKGWKLNQHGLFYIKNGRRVSGSEKITSERELAEFLGVSYRSPTNRIR